MRAASICVETRPKGVVYMEGYADEARKLPALGVHDSPKSVLLLLEWEDERVLFVSLDICVLSRERIDPLVEQLSACLDMSQDHIVVSAIHSHSCPTGFAQIDMGNGVSFGYEQMVTGEVLMAATHLAERLVSVRAELVSTCIHGWYGNRSDKDRAFDDSAYVLRFVSETDGSVAGAMLNFNCHATVLGPKNRYVSADVLGAVRSELTEWIGITPYTFTGASADLGNRQFRQGNDFPELVRTTNGIAGCIMKGAFEPCSLDVPRVRRFMYRVHFDAAEYHDAYRIQLAAVERKLSGELSFDERKLAVSEKCALEMKLKTEVVDFPLEMTLLDFGSIVFVAFPGELASDLGQRVKAMFPGRVALVVGYANDYQGYFMTEADFGTCYETLATSMPQGGIERILELFEEWL